MIRPNYPMPFGLMMSQRQQTQPGLMQLPQLPQQQPGLLDIFQKLGSGAGGLAKLMAMFRGTGKE